MSVGHTRRTTNDISWGNSFCTRHDGRGGIAEHSAAKCRCAIRGIASKTPGKVHLLPATLETTQWGWFDNAQAPVLRIDSGDTVVLETMMHSHNQVVPGRRSRRSRSCVPIIPAAVRTR